MCGIVGIAVTAGGRPSVDAHAVARLRDTLAHRGPDDAGLHDAGHVILGHRRLSILDLSAAGHQPMVSECGRLALAYNGELYNDAEIRRDLEHAGVRLRTTCDTETVLLALATWGLPAIDRFRGMFALAYLDLKRQRLTLARDSLGIKPLFYWLGEPRSALAPPGQRELVFASEIAAILAHPHVPARPDWASLSGYLTTIRVTTGDRTIWDGVRTLLPGEVRTFSLAKADDASAALSSTRGWIRYAGNTEADESLRDTDEAHVAALVRDRVEDSVVRHLRSDVPLGLMLSGGLDSSIIASIATRLTRSADGSGHRLRTYAASHADPSLPAGDDERFAELMAREIGSEHTLVAVSRDDFLNHWQERVRTSRTPLSTPNEVAIGRIAARMRSDGLRVALSGEGADELFAGYEPALLDTLAFERTSPSRNERALFALHALGWVPLDTKPSVLNPDLWHRLEHDAALRTSAEEQLLAAERDAVDDDPLRVHLAVQRRVNLHGLLLRLDACTMRHAIEGRTPLADASIASLASSLPRRLLFDPTRRTDGAAEPISKLALRAAFARDLPQAILNREKASFPLPFRAWMTPIAPIVRDSALVREMFNPAAIELVAASPKAVWSLAWPMINLALWDAR